MIEKEPKISVCVAIYNIDKFVEKCIQSIIDQDYKNIEIILVDDNSSDESGIICDKYAKLDKRIKVLHHKKNTKLPGVRNDGIKMSTGEYIVFVDGDDWLAKDCVSYLVKVITENDADFGINLVNYTTRDTNEVSERPIKTWSPEKATVELLWPRISIGAWNKIYRRDFIIKNDLWFKDLYTAEGLRFFTDVSQRVEKVSVGCKRVYYYRLNNTESATTKYDIKQSMSSIEVAEGIKKDLVIKTQKVIDAADHHIWRNHWWNIQQITALCLKKKNKNDYLRSRKYLRKNMFKISMMESRVKTKIFAILCGLCPIFLAKIVNYRFKKRLKNDNYS